VGTGGQDFFDWLVGSDILVKAVGESEVESVQVYFPEMICYGFLLSLMVLSIRAQVLLKFLSRLIE
jgi:hypothetical protein